MYRPLLASAVLATALVITGCANSDHPDQIPASAIKVGESDKTISYTAPADGMVYVYDAGSDRIVWSGEVDAGKTVTVNTTDDKIMVGDRLAAQKLLHDNHEHKIFFQRMPLAADHDKVIIQKQTTVERRAE